MKTNNLQISSSSLVLKIVLISAFLVLSAAVFLFSPILSIVMMAFSPIILFYSQGVEIDTEQRKMRNYTSFLGFRNGKWNSLESYQGIVVISTKGKKRAHHMTSERNINTKGLIHKVFLVDKSHRRRLLIKRTEDEIDTQDIVLELKNELDLPIQKYNPVLSKRTLENRNK